MTNIEHNDSASLAPALTLIVWGRDEAGKPHASKFMGQEAELAEKAAGLMGMRVLRVEGDAHSDLVAKLPVGRVFASGKAFVPFLRQGLYEQLCTLSGVPVEAEPPQGHRKAGRAAGPAASKAAPPSLPTSWDDIAPGSIVLATTGPMEGWFESVVVEVKEGSLVMVWRDWPDEPPFVRALSQTGLLPRNPAIQA